MRRHFWRAVALVTVVALGACGTAPPVPETQYHQLPLPVTDRATAVPIIAQIVVLPFKADDLRQDRAIVYSPAAPHLTLQQSHYHFWVDPPPRLLQQHLADWLRVHGIAGKVTAADHTPAGSGIWLRGRIVRMEHEVGSGEPRVHVAIDLQAGQAGEDAARLQHRFEVLQPVVVGASVEAVVQAFADSFDKVWNDVARELRAGIITGDLLP